MNKQEKIIYGVLVFIATLAIIIALLSGKGQICHPQKYVILESIVIVLTIVSLPLILKLHKQKTDNTSSPTKLHQWNTIRLATSFIIILMNAISYGICYSSSLLFCAGIAWIFLVFFCKPVPYTEDNINE